MKIIILEDSSVDKTNLVGGSIIELRNLQIMQDVFSDNNVETLRYTLPDIKTTKGRLIRRAFFFNAGMSYRKICKITTEIISTKPDVVFISNALLGLLAKVLKKRAPQIHIVTFFHNVESDFFRDLTKNYNKISGSIIRQLVKQNEVRSVKFSDTLVVLNKRDSNRLQELYGRNADLILPTSFVDNYKPQNRESNESKIKLLFVGFNFFANLEGVEWLVNHVMSKLDDRFTLYIVGRNMEKERERLTRSNVEVVGTVDNISDWYNKCDIVVLPIFSGSGMKTKTAEAMMYQKPIIANKESFEGYEIDDYSKIGSICQTAEDFIKQIKLLAENPHAITEKGENARKLFLEKYDYKQVLKLARDYFQHIFKQHLHGCN